MSIFSHITNVVITSLLSVVCVSCNVTNKESVTNEGRVNQYKGNDTLKVEKFRYYDLFSMSGIEPYSGDSAVTVVQANDSMVISINNPERYSQTFRNMGSYWYSKAEFDMYKNRYFLTMSEIGGPRKYDRFIQKDTIFEFCQMYFKDDVDKTVYIKTPKIYTVYHLKTEHYTDSVPSKIYDRILRVKSGDSSNVTDKSILRVERYSNEVEFISEESGYKFSRTYPEILIWGGGYGL